MKPERLVGILGGAAVGCGLLFPVVHLSVLGDLSSFDLAPILTGLLVLTAIGAACFSFRGNAGNTLLTSLLAFAATGLLFYKALVRIGLAEQELTAKIGALAVQAGMATNDLPIRSLMSETRMGGCLWVLLLGAILILIAGIRMRRSGGTGQHASHSE